MNDLEELKREIESRIPGVKGSLDLPTNSRAGGFLELRLKDRGAVVEWEPQSLFGISSIKPDPIYGEGADEVYHGLSSAAKRLVELLVEGRQTQSNADRLLQNLRTKMGMSQIELARALNVSQPTLSKIERRPDILLSTMRRIVHGMGGTLEINAVFPTERIRLVQLAPESAYKKDASSKQHARRRTRKASQKAKS